MARWADAGRTQKKIPSFLPEELAKAVAADRHRNPTQLLRRYLEYLNARVVASHRHAETTNSVPATSFVNLAALFFGPSLARSMTPIGPSEVAHGRIVTSLFGTDSCMAASLLV